MDGFFSFSIIPQSRTCLGWVQGKLPYSGNVDCAMKILKHEGVLGFYKGFGTFLIRIGPHVSMTLILLDVMKRNLP